MSRLWCLSVRFIPQLLESDSLTLEWQCSPHRSHSASSGGGPIMEVLYKHQIWRSFSVLFGSWLVHWGQLLVETLKKYLLLGLEWSKWPKWSRKYQSKVTFSIMGVVCCHPRHHLSCRTCTWLFAVWYSCLCSICRVFVVWILYHFFQWP